MKNVLFTIYPIVSSGNTPYFKCTTRDIKPDALLRELAKNNEGLYLLPMGIYLHVPVSASNTEIYEAFAYAEKKRKITLLFELIEELLRIGATTLTADVIENGLSNMKKRCSKFFKELLNALKEKAAQFASIVINISATLAPKLTKCPLCSVN